jgi:hypothetical protein
MIQVDNKMFKKVYVTLQDVRSYLNNRQGGPVIPGSGPWSSRSNKQPTPRAKILSSFSWSNPGFELRDRLPKGRLNIEFPEVGFEKQKPVENTAFERWARASKQPTLYVLIAKNGNYESWSGRTARKIFLSAYWRLQGWKVTIIDNAKKSDLEEALKNPEIAGVAVDGDGRWDAWYDSDGATVTESEVRNWMAEQPVKKLLFVNYASAHSKESAEKSEEEQKTMSNVSEANRFGWSAVEHPNEQVRGFGGNILPVWLQIKPDGFTLSEVKSGNGLMFKLLHNYHLGPVVSMFSWTAAFLATVVSLIGLDYWLADSFLLAVCGPMVLSPLLVIGFLSGLMPAFMTLFSPKHRVKIQSSEVGFEKQKPVENTAFKRWSEEGEAIHQDQDFDFYSEDSWLPGSKSSEVGVAKMPVQNTAFERWSGYNNTTILMSDGLRGIKAPIRFPYGKSVFDVSPASLALIEQAI